MNRIVEADKKVLDKATQMSRITRKSYRPRVSDRTMVDTPYNRQGLHCFQDRVASSSPENRTTKMENKINQVVRGTPEPSVSRGRSGGWKSRNFSQLPVAGKIFLLTFPFIGEAVNYSFDFAGDLTCIGSTPFQKPLEEPPAQPLIPQHASWALSAFREDYFPNLITIVCSIPCVSSLHQLSITARNSSSVP